MTLYMLFATIAAGFGGAHAVFGLQFVIVVSLSALLAAILVFYARRHMGGVTLAMFVGAIFLAAATVDNYTPAANAKANVPVAVFSEQSTRALEAGEKLFLELGCTGCHLSDGKGIGPSLNGVFGRPVTEPGCGALTVDEEYVRESILNPSATVVAGFAPVMPTFAGRVTEEQLRALTAYVKSLGEPVQARKPTGELR